MLLVMSSEQSPAVVAANDTGAVVLCFAKEKKRRELAAIFRQNPQKSVADLVKDPHFFQQFERILNG